MHGFGAEVFIEEVRKCNDMMIYSSLSKDPVISPHFKTNEIVSLDGTRKCDRSEEIK